MPLSPSPCIYFATVNPKPSRRSKSDFLEATVGTGCAALEVFIGYHGTPQQKEIPSEAAVIGSSQGCFAGGRDPDRVPGRQFTWSLLFSGRADQQRLDTRTHLDAALGDYSGRTRPRPVRSPGSANRNN